MLDRNKYPILKKIVRTGMLTKDETNGEPLPIVVQLGDYWLLYRTTHLLNYETARATVLFGALLTHKLPEMIPGNVDEAVTRILYGIKTLPKPDERMITVSFLELGFLYDRAPTYTNERDCLLSFSYALLRRRDLTHTEAAQFAAAILEKPINAEAWRKRVVRWAEDQQDLPKIEQRRPKRTSAPGGVRKS